MRRQILTALIPAVLATALGAQSLNVDFGTDPAYAGVPPSSYGGAAGQPGVWNSIAAPSSTPVQLVDLAGTLSVVAVACSGPAYTFDTIPASLGVHGPLLGDWFETYNGSFHVDVSGLTDGWYDVFTYAAVVDVPTGTQVAVPGSPDPVQMVYMPSGYSGDLAPGISHARHRVQVSGGALSIQITAFVDPNGFGIGYGACNGLQLVRLDASTETVCAGDGSGTACPCGNSGGPGRGCANSFDATGAGLTAAGVADVSADTLVLTATGVSNSVVTFFQGTQAVQGGLGSVFGDGLRCAGGNTIRLGAKLASANLASYPGVLDVPVSIRGAVPSSGATRLYQVWYRNAAAFCTASTFNLTNGLMVAWSP